MTCKVSRNHARGCATAALLACLITAPLLAEDGRTDPRYLGGIWDSERFFVMIGGTPRLPETEEMIQNYVRATDSGRILGTAWTTCRPGSPSAMFMVQGSLVVLQTDDEITISLEQPRMTRRIRLNTEHPADLEASYMGHSVGHWEGNTLVIETIGFNGNFELDALAQPTSTRLHTVERLTKSADGSRVAIEVTITDPEYYSEPFTVDRGWVATDRRHPLEYDGMENPRAEEIEHTMFIREGYRPVCRAFQGEGMELSRIICDNPDDDVPSGSR
jgi:hypothetical protein